MKKIKFLIIILMFSGLFLTNSSMSQSSKSQAQLIISSSCKFFPIKVYLDGQLVGTLTKTSFDPQYGDAKAISLMVDLGAHVIEGVDKEGNKWSSAGKTINVRQEGYKYSFSC